MVEIIREFRHLPIDYAILLSIVVVLVVGSVTSMIGRIFNRKKQ